MGRSDVRWLIPSVGLLALLAVAQCSTPAPVVSAQVCPPPVAYSAADEQRAAVEYDALPAGAELRQMMDDYRAERAALRACRQGDR